MEARQINNNGHTFYKCSAISLEILQVTPQPEEPRDLHPLFLISKPTLSLPDSQSQNRYIDSECKSFLNMYRLHIISTCIFPHSRVQCNKIPS